jgi:hypothetical protein
MPRICYQSKRFRAAALTMIEQANTIIDEYLQQGFDLTLRQLYYQFVSRALLSNTAESYKQLGNVVSDGRLAGLIDWNRIEDRTRGVERLTTWTTPSNIISACASQFRIDRWATQPYRVEVWIEKEALAGVFEGICNTHRVPYLSCRGYTSQSEMWRAGQRILGYINSKQTPLILHFGDHDPSGIDMTRDIKYRLKMFCRREIKIKRLALNMPQVEEHNPPPNPAKMTDTRAERYTLAYGDESWELDALNPTILTVLVESEILAVRDQAAWSESGEEEQEARRLLTAVSDDWNSLTEGL